VADGDDPGTIRPQLPPDPCGAARDACPKAGANHQSLRHRLLRESSRIFSLCRRQGALNAACDAAAQETAAFGIKFTQVIPSPYRTDFIGLSFDHAPRIPEYEATVGKFGAYLAKVEGKQPGDPAAAARLILDLLDEEKPPFRLVIGQYATTTFTKKLAASEAELTIWKDPGLATDFPPGI